MAEATDRTPSEPVDVCVVGAGPAGALVAHRLADAGHEVVVLEAGPRFDDGDAGGEVAEPVTADGGTPTAAREQRMEASIRPGQGGVWGMGGERDAYTTAGRPYPLNQARVKGVGGSTLHWQGMVFRLHESDFELASRHGVGRDWPIGYEDLRPYYAAAEAALGVAGASDNPFAPPREQPHPMPAFPPSYSDGLFAAACEQLGITTHSVPNARNSQQYGGRGVCQGYGTCKPVCPSGAKYDATVHARRAEAAGARIVDRAPVQRLAHDAAGDRVTAAVYATPDGTEHRQRARQFVVAAGGVETPRLLLLSRSEQYPDGLANGSGWVGRGFMDHLFAGAGGIVDERTRQNHVGFITTETHQFYEDPTRATAGTDGGIPAAAAADGRSDLAAIKLEFFNYAGPSPAGLALGADTWGDDLLTELRGAYGHHVGIGGLVGQLPRADNRVTLDPAETDDHGNPVPKMVWSLSARTRRTIERANEIQHAILDELGARDRWTVGPENTGPAFHHMGTTRMGTDPDESVVDPRCRTHELDNLWVSGPSTFVTGGSLNPTLTIVALALRVADAVEGAL